MQLLHQLLQGINNLWVNMQVSSISLNSDITLLHGQSWKRKHYIPTFLVLAWISYAELYVVVLVELSNQGVLDLSRMNRILYVATYLNYCTIVDPWIWILSIFWLKSLLLSQELLRFECPYQCSSLMYTCFHISDNATAESQNSWSWLQKLNCWGSSLFKCLVTGHLSSLPKLQNTDIAGLLRTSKCNVRFYCTLSKLITLLWTSAMIAKAFILS